MLTVVQEDITKMRVDAIVNAANTQLLAGGGVCGAIFRAAGYQELQNACNKLAPISTGEAVITPGFNLPAKFIIHTAGPIYKGGNFDEEKKLCACYKNSLQLAQSNNLNSIAFPLISSGIYGYPPIEALKVAVNSIEDFLQTSDMHVFLSVLDRNLLEKFKELIR